MTRRLLILLASMALSCSYASPIRPAATSDSAFWWPGWGDPVRVVTEDPSGDQWRISHRGSSGFIPVSAVRNSAQARADEFCAKKGSVVTPITEQVSGGVPILGNFPRYEMVFVCTKPEAVPSAENPYDRLKRLKGLLDEGVISQSEFDREKQELLDK